MNQRTILVSANQELIGALRIALTTQISGISCEALTDAPAVSALRTLLDSSREPVVAVVVDLADRERGLSLVRAISTSHPEVLVAGTEASPSGDTILEAMRAGASEFLTPPFDLEAFAASLARRGKQVKKPAQVGRLVCFLPAQSANGASTVALHAAHAAAQGLQAKVLLAELDFHAGSLAQRLQLKPKHTLADLLDRTDRIHQLWDEVVCHWQGIDILPAPTSSRPIASKGLHDIGAIFQAATIAYAAVAVDLPSPLFSSSRDVLTIADAVYLVCTPDVTSVHLTRRRVFELSQLGLAESCLHLVVNRVGSSQLMHAHDIAQAVGLPLAWTLNNDYAAWSEASAKGELVSTERPLGRQLYELGCHAMGVKKVDDSTPKRGGWKSFLPFQKSAARTVTKS